MLSMTPEYGSVREDHDPRNIGPWECQGESKSRAIILSGCHSPASIDSTLGNILILNARTAEKALHL